MLCCVLLAMLALQVLPLVREHIPLGGTIGCVTATTNLITCSVSNWGGYALAGALAVLAATAAPDESLEAEACPGADSPTDRFLPSAEAETLACEAMVAAGARDGVTKQPEATVDGMPFQRSLDILVALAFIARGGGGASAQ